MGFLKDWVDGFKLHPAPLVDTPESAAHQAAPADYPDIRKASTSNRPTEKTSLDDSLATAGGPAGEAGIAQVEGTDSLHMDIAADDPGLKRRLNQFHIQMIAFGGSIGTGLYIGSGSVYASGGPGFLILDYCLIGSMLYCVVMCLGELAVIFPVSGSFSTYSTRFVSPAWGFAMGWNCACAVDSPLPYTRLAPLTLGWAHAFH